MNAAVAATAPRPGYLELKANVHRKAVPSGTYKVVLTATKVKSFTDARANSTQTWTSPAFTLRGE